MRLPKPKPKRRRVRIKSKSEHSGSEPRTLYELTPESFAGPWTLPVGTVLEIVSKPDPKT